MTTANEEQLKTCARWINESKRRGIYEPGSVRIGDT